MSKQIVLSVAVLATMLCVSAESRAQTTCNNSGSWCIGYENTSATIGSKAIYGLNDTSSNDAILGEDDSESGVGVQGYSLHDGTGVWGRSIGGGDGVSGVSGTYNGVEGNSGGSGASGVYGHNSNGGFGVAGRSTATGTAIYGDNTSSSGWAGYFTGRTYCPAGVFSSSDARLKKDIKPLDGAIDQLLQLHGVTFEWKDPEARGRGMQRGFIAQDVEKVFPQWVDTDHEGFKAVNTRGIEAMLVESIRTLKTENDALRSQSSKLEDRVNALEANRRPMISGLGAEGMGMGFGLVALGGAFLVSRRKRSGSGDRQQS